MAVARVGGASLGSEAAIPRHHHAHPFCHSSSPIGNAIVHPRRVGVTFALASSMILDMVSRFTTPTAIAAYLGVTSKTVCNWINAGKLRAVRLPPHYADERPRKTTMHRWRVHEADLAEFLGHRDELPATLFPRVRCKR